MDFIPEDAYSEEDAKMAIATAKEFLDMAGDIVKL